MLKASQVAISGGRDPRFNDLDCLIAIEEAEERRRAINEENERRRLIAEERERRAQQIKEAEERRRAINEERERRAIQIKEAAVAAIQLPATERSKRRRPTPTERAIKLAEELGSKPEGRRLKLLIEAQQWKELRAQAEFINGLRRARAVLDRGILDRQYVVSDAQLHRACGGAA